MKSFFVTAITAVIVFGLFTGLRHWMDAQVRELNTHTPIAPAQTSVASSTATVSDKDVAFCSFVYGPIFEVGRDHDHAGLLIYGQSRMTFVGGFLAANQSNRAFAHVYEDNLQKNKRAAKIVKKLLLEALSENDPEQFGKVMSEAAWCDGKLGLDPKWLPTLHRPGIPQ